VLDDDPPGRFVDLCHEAVHEIISLRTRTIGVGMTSAARRGSGIS